MQARRHVVNHTLVGIQRCWELWDLVSQAPDGHVLEVGTYKGGSGCILAKAAQVYHPKSWVFLTDTFQGIVKTGPNDNYHQDGQFSNTSVELVQELVDSLGLTNVKLLQGTFPEDTGHQVCGTIALCHIDVDVYQSGKDVMTWLEPNLVPGSIVVADDYGWKDCQGMALLVDEIRATGKYNFIYNLNGHAVLFRKNF